ncbi:MAG: polysaccharide deacetylase family protein [Gammaproteobacteria bacterium]|nr:polysaccharide deacetylase family protein [Gammaproteobacteria bacterium]
MNECLVETEPQKFEWLKRNMLRAVTASGIGGLVARMRAEGPHILMYHGVSARARRGLENCEGKHVELDIFVRQLQAVAESRRVIPLTALIAGIRSGETLRDAVAITFDDGYENNVLNAAPVLAELGMSATFFLATGYIGTDRWLWVDRLEFLLNRATCNQMRLPGVPFEIPLRTLADKQRALRCIKEYVKMRRGGNTIDVIQEMEQLCGGDGTPPYGDYRFMSWEQVRQLADAGFDIGAHTVNHAILSQRRLDEAKREILVSRDRVVSEVGRCSRVFCYPNGRAGDYTPEIARWCAQHFDAALSAEYGPVRVSDLFQLKRIGVCNATTAENLRRELPKTG